MPGEVSRSYTGPADDTGRPKAITCDAIRRICEADGKDYAVLISVDRSAGNTLFTTWGRTPEDKVDASDLSDHLSAELCPTPRGPGVVYESFKLDAAKNKARVEGMAAVLFDVYILCTLLDLANRGDGPSMDAAFRQAAHVLDLLEPLRPLSQELHTEPR